MQSELTGMDIDTHDGDPRLERHIVGIGYDFATANARATLQHRIHQPVTCFVTQRRIPGDSAWHAAASTSLAIRLDEISVKRPL